MSLRRKVDADDLAVLMLIEDPVWLAEFLRTTNYGDTNRANWRKNGQFKLRPYQRELITDQTRNIVVTGGRSIGKCQPASARVYTTQGYVPIHQLRRQPSFVTYGITPEHELIMRRATITKDQIKHVYTLRTASGHTLDGTAVHPVLTPGGYLTLDALKPGDRVAVATKLPTTHCVTDSLSWAELRVLGYLALSGPFIRSVVGITPRFAAVDAELKYIAGELFCRYRKDKTGNVYLLRRSGGLYKHPITQLKYDLDIYDTSNTRPVHLRFLKTQKLENLKVYLEAVYAQYGHLSRNAVYLDVYHEQLAREYQELLLYFGIESRLDVIKPRPVNDIRNSDGVYRVSLLDEQAVYRFWTTFTLPGVSIGQLRQPPSTPDRINEWSRWDTIESITQHEQPVTTYAVHVYKDETYIADNVVNHNSVILEDVQVYEIVNNDIMFPETPEQVLVTPNLNQMTPLLDRLILRFLSSPLLKDFLSGNVNRTKGTLDFKTYGRSHRMYARIAGGKGEQNMVGLHINKIRGDEMQLFPMPAFTQLQPTLNVWEKRTQQTYCGVPNNLRNMTLYQLDQKAGNFKKYRIPAPNNPYWTYEDHIEALKRYNGEEDDRFQNLVLGRWGAASYQVINRESIIIEPFDFYSYRYSAQDKAKGKTYREALSLPKLPKMDAAILAVDTGFVDPTIIQLMGMLGGKWRTYARWKLNRIDFPEQEQILDWIATNYAVPRIAIDIGAGGGGAGISQSLIARPEYDGKNYKDRLIPVNFAESIAAGTSMDGEAITLPVKAYAGGELAKLIENGLLVFSELDTEGLSQIERITKQRSPAGYDRYYVLSERGTGASNDDHIFAAFVCFIVALQHREAATSTKKLGKPTGSLTK